ncbi:MAG: hypothetical protein ACRDN6_11220 [Gaiellaceae bacterium]
MKGFRLFLCVLLGALVAAGSAQADGSLDDDLDCRRVSAVGVGQDLGGGNTTATITRDGLLKGTTAAHFDITGGAPPELTFTGTVVFTTKRGTLTVSIAGTFNVATGAFAATGPVTGGTEAFAGASGSLSFAGVEDLTTGRFTETVTGTVCLADDGDDDDD